MCSGSPAVPPGVSTRTLVPLMYAASAGSPMSHSKSAASSIITVTSPVFPLPVIPSTTP